MRPAYPFRANTFFHSISLGLLVALVAAPGSAVANENELRRHAFAETHMGTRFEILLYAAEEREARQAATAAFARIAVLDRMMSDYRADSELMLLCKAFEKAGSATPVRVCDELFFVLSKAQEMSRLSDGAFDVSVGPLVRLWRRSRRSQLMPEPEELAQARARVSYRHIRLDARSKTVQLMKAGMQLDLGGIAKGYAADEALAVLKKRGVTRALVAAGGDIVASGPPPDAMGWTVGIAPLADPDSKPDRFLLLRDGAVSTSGDAEQHVEIGGKRYSHLLDPRTGLGLEGRRSVTVVAPNGITADSATKAVSVLGPKKGLALIQTLPGCWARYVQKTERGEAVFESPHFPAAASGGKPPKDGKSP